ncbi:MAG TPA: alanine racemase, partial [Candidatus Limnocylindrales bacterium]
MSTALPFAFPPGLDTPTLLIDIDIVERNADRMADEMERRGIALRPHTKTHKSVALARLQLEAGARGVTVGTLGEAEVLADAGFIDIFVAYPVWAAGPKAERLRALLARPSLRLGVGFDSAAGAERLAAAVAGAERQLEVLLEVDPGNRRTGVAPADAGPIAAVARAAGLEVVGLFTHGGHAYARPGAAAEAATDELEALSAAIASYETVGIQPRVVSAGSTPTALGAAATPVTEVRPGTYLLGDRTQVALGGSPADGVAIAIGATVVSAAVPGQVVIDAGAKTLTKDIQPYLVGYGGIAG